MITSVLVANRGEIARRIFRTAHDLGLSCVAVHSTADAEAPFVAEADAAVHLPGNAAADTYLRADLLIDAARRAGADAIHPGYGFLSENASFAQAVIEAGLSWIGPPPEAIESMGSKLEAKRLMAAAGVPVLAAHSSDEVTDLDLPVIVKASAGGGGRGMRVVHRSGDLAGAIAAASAEAASTFGDGTVFCEPYLAAVRHIEVQVMADQHGTVWAVGERECSIQRRHQKVIEEAPSPLVERLRWMRAGLFDAARKAASAIGYVGAGTVEFLADDNGRFYFLEMNTRLQVEHPVTECTTGLDLVRLQFAIASGRRLEPEPPPTVGHSIEVRLYAEDPAQDWQPQSGTLHRFHVPGVTQEFTSPLSTIGPNPPLVDGGPACAAGTEGRIGTDRRQGWGNLLRVDSGVVDGSSVSAYYDAMLAKVIVWAPTRTDATTKLAAALARAELHGLRTNRDLLVRVLRHPAFQAGDTDTAFLDRNGLDTLTEPLADKDTETLSALAAALADAARRRERAPVQKRLPSGWRNLPSVPQRKTFTVGDASYEVAYRLTRDGLVAAGMETVRLIRMEPHHVVLEVDGVRRAFRVVAYPGLVCVDSPLGAVALTPAERFADPLQHIVAGSLLAPMPGTVLRLGIAVGDRVVRGQPLIWLEAMKMEHTVSAPADGIVGEVAVAAGQQVELGAVLAVVQEGSDADLGRATQQQTATEEEQ